MEGGSLPLRVYCPPLQRVLAEGYVVTGIAPGLQGRWRPGGRLRRCPGRRVIFWEPRASTDCHYSTRGVGRKGGGGGGTLVPEFAARGHG